MKSIFKAEAIGIVEQNEGRFFIRINSRYREGLKGISDFSHIQIIWWGHLADHPEKRNKLMTGKLFKNAPGESGVFATRSPRRPNPILISTVKVENYDIRNGLISLNFIDAEPGTPVLDIKPYFPMERVKECKVPDWCDHWPEWYEEVQGFEWKKEINFPG